LRSSSRMRPLKLSQKPFCIGFPGTMKCQRRSGCPAPRRAWAQGGELGPIVPHDHAGLPETPDQHCQFARHASRRPEIEVSGIAAKHSRFTSSTMFRMRNRRPQTNSPSLPRVAGLAACAPSGLLRDKAGTHSLHPSVLLKGRTLNPVEENLSGRSIVTYFGAVLS
jgi:hypothetical protein